MSKAFAAKGFGACLNYNTAHPHTHIIVRGKDEKGADLVIARDYLTSGLRARATELVDLDLGPRTQKEIARTLRAQVDQDRLTVLDRALLKDVGADQVVSNVGRDAVDRTLRAGRLAKLARLGLATPLGGGRYQLADDLKETLQRMGERGDIIRTMQSAFARARTARTGIDQAIYEAAPDARTLVGCIVVRGLADEHHDRHYLLVDGVDGRTHYVAIGRGIDVDADLPHGAIIRIDPLKAEVRGVDRTIVAVAAANGGRYDVDAHLRHDPTASETLAQSHVRRLEAMRRGALIVARAPSGSWIIAPDHLARVAAYEAARLRDGPVQVTILSRVPLAQLAGAEAATWIDRELVSGSPVALRDAGFGPDVRDGLARRRQWLVAQGLAQVRNGDISFQNGMIATLQRRELRQVAGPLSEELARPYRETAQAGQVEGLYRRPMDLMSGRFAVIERTHDFMLVPWRPVLDRQIGKIVSGLMRDGHVSWSFGRRREGPSIS